MVANYISLIRAPRQVQPSQVLPLVGFPHGLNTSLPVFQIQKTECSALINFTIQKGGTLVTRDAISKHTTAATTSNSAIISHAQVNIGSTSYTILQDANYVVYYLDSDPKPVTIGSLAAEASIIGYNGVAVLLDGDYVKYIDNVSGIKIAYDDGTGSTGYQFDNRALVSGGSLKLGDGTNNRIATSFTSQAWTSGYTIPPTTISAYLFKTGAPTGSITCKIRKVSDDSVLATETFLADVSTLTATSTLYTATFSVITTEMSPSTAYYASLEYSGGDASNYVNVDCEAVASGGMASVYTTSWTADVTHNPLMALKPGRPPKGKFGDIKFSRLFMAGDPDNPGYVWFSNLTHLDWSTPNGGGYIGAVDDHKDNYEVGGIATLYGDLIVYGTKSQPYLSKLTGSSPTDYALPATFQKPWTTHKTLVNAMNDLWAGSGDGVDPVSGVQEYGDLRTFSASDPVSDRLDNYWNSDTAFAGYYPKEGQYWLIMPSYHRVLATHTKIPVPEISGQGFRYPWTEYEFYRDIFTSSSYNWIKSANGTNEYYMVDAVTQDDPGIITKPDFLTLDGTKITEGTVGSLSDHQWAYADNDGLGFTTVYFADASGDPDTSGVEIRSILLPTSIGQAESNFLIGGSDGYFYRPDASEYKDLGLHQMNPKGATSYTEIPFGYANFSQFQLVASSTSGGTIGVDFYTDGRKVTDASSISTVMAVSDGLTVEEAIMDVDDAYFSVDIEQVELFRQINFNARAIMIVFKDILITGYPIYLAGVLLKFRRLSH